MKTPKEITDELVGTGAVKLARRDEVEAAIAAGLEESGDEDEDDDQVEDEVEDSKPTPVPTPSTRPATPSSASGLGRSSDPDESPAG